MKIETAREQLLTLLAPVVRVVPRNPSLAILGHALLVGDGDELSAATTDMEMQIVSRASISAEGRVTLPVHKLHDIAKNLPAGAAITITVDGDSATVRSGRSRFKLVTLLAEGFPALEFDEETDPVVRDLPCQELATLLGAGYAMAKGDVRYYLNGMLIEIDGEDATAAATDGHRLAAVLRSLPGGQGSARVILPRRAVDEMTRMLAGVGDARLEIGGTWAGLTVGQVSMTARLIDGRYPDYRRAMPSTDGVAPVTVNRSDLLHAVRRAAILVDERLRGISLELRPGEIEIAAHEGGESRSSEVVECSGEEEAAPTGLNWTLLADALGAVDDETVLIYRTDSGAVVITPMEGDDRHVVMPMRI